MRAFAQVLSSSLDLSLGKKSAYDVEQLFERCQELNFQPDNVVNFHERLRKAKVLNTTLRSFQSSGAFRTYYGTFKYKVVWGVPCRASYFESLS